MTEWLSGLTAPWAGLYGDSVAVEGTVVFAHLAGLLVAGGFALATDRASLRAAGRGAAVRSAFLEELHDIHRPVLIGLAVVLVSGMALALADVETFLPSKLFWTKMVAFALLLANGATVQRAERSLLADPADPGGWRRLRAAALRSATLWGATLFLGVLLPLAA